MKIEKVLDNLPVVTEANGVYLIKKEVNSENIIECHIVNSANTETFNVSGAVEDPSLKGPSAGFTKHTLDYLITNYDIFTNYTIEPVVGSVTRTLNTVNLTTTAVNGSHSFKFNNKLYQINVVKPTVALPVIVTPVNNATVPLPLAVETSTLSFVEAGVNSSLYNKIHTQIQIATDINFTNIVYDAVDTDNNTNITVEGLTTETVYYTRIRFNVEDIGISNWSNININTIEAGQQYLVFDTFTDLNNVILTNHIGEIGAIWTAAPDNYDSGLDLYTVGPSTNMVLSNNALSPNTATNSEYYVATPSGGSLVGLTHFTIEIGIELRTGVSYSNVEIHSVPNLSNLFNNKLLLIELSDYLPEGNYASMQLNGNGIYYPLNANQTISFNTEHIFKAVYNGNNAKLYLNDVLIGSETAGLTIPSLSDIITLSVRVNNTNPQTNPITYFKFYEHVLTDIIFDSFTETVKTNLINHITDTGQSWGQGDWGLNSVSPDTLKLEVNTDGTSSVLEYSNGDVPGTDTAYGSIQNNKAIAWVNFPIPSYNYFIEANVNILADADDSYVTLIGRIQSAPGTGTSDYVDINWWPSPSWAPGTSTINDSVWGSGLLTTTPATINEAFVGLHLLRIEFINDNCSVYIDGILRTTVSIDTAVIIPGTGGYVGYGITANTQNYDSPGIKVLDFKVGAI
jgi:hypothetical protein